MERVLKQTKYDICEEVKFEILLDWMSCNSGLEEEAAVLLSLIQFKCFKQVQDIQQAKSDLSQLNFLLSENLEEVLLRCEEAITFKQKEWNLEELNEVGAKNVLLLSVTKSDANWPKLLGYANHNGSHGWGEYQILNHDGLRLSGDDHCMINLRRALSYSPNISYKSSIFYIHYPITNIPQLCQFNFDFKKCFHVLDLPLAIKSINDQHKHRRNLVMVCNVDNYLYLFSKDAFSKQNFDTAEKLKVYRIDLDLVTESCNEFLGAKNALLLKWEHFTDIPEIYLEANENSFDYDIKAVDVGKNIFIVSNDLCICFNVAEKVWTDRELSPPARNNPIVFGSGCELFVVGGTCMGQPLVSGQKYNTETWKMSLLPNIPAVIFPAQNLKYYKGLHFKNFLYLYSSNTGTGLMLVLDLFLSQWETQPSPAADLFCLDKPIWL